MKTPQTGPVHDVPATHALHAQAVPQQVGKYLVSPLVKCLGNGWFASSVSIRSGSGSATTDRVLRLTRMFLSVPEAVAYARAEGLRWIQGTGHAHRAAAA